MEVTKQIMMCDKCFDKKSVFDLSKVSDRKCAVCDTNYCSDKIHRGQEYSSTEHLPREYPFPFVCKDCRDMALNGKYESRIPRLSNKSLNGSCSSFSIQLGCFVQGYMDNAMDIAYTELISALKDVVSGAVKKFKKKEEIEILKEKLAKKLSDFRS